MLKTKNKFEIEIGTKKGYGYVDSLPKILEDIEEEYGSEEREKVEKWASSSKRYDAYENKNLRVVNLTKDGGVDADE